ncbi:hypothetical protein QTI51_36770 [Variovorax sp. J22G73]|uniref:hypothetical protein n=1 Tax=unclassified Variovorax TaxID=663243 RepID=UPI002575439B|nr:MULTISPECIES: hypothetical protein [unclassified Variovorax]MDM0010535.1 hypothetical protein [Variovorax sp. J22R203]MDM0102882.1 hypothetical protein [Variovorax sp. J22G73]
MGVSLTFQFIFGAALPQTLMDSSHASSSTIFPLKDRFTVLIFRWWAARLFRSENRGTPGVFAPANEAFSPTTFRKVHLLGARIDERAMFGTIADLYWRLNTDSKFWDPKYSKEVRGHLDNHLKPHLLWKTPMCTTSVPVAMGSIERCAQDFVSIAYKVLSLVRATANHAIEIGCIDATPLTSLRPNSRIRKYRLDSKMGKRTYPPSLKLCAWPSSCATTRRHASKCGCAMSFSPIPACEYPTRSR